MLNDSSSFPTTLSLQQWRLQQLTERFYVPLLHSLQGKARDRGSLLHIAATFGVGASSLSLAPGQPEPPNHSSLGCSGLSQAMVPPGCSRRKSYQKNITNMLSDITVHQKELSLGWWGWVCKPWVGRKLFQVRCSSLEPSVNKQRRWNEAEMGGTFTPTAAKRGSLFGTPFKHVHYLWLGIFCVRLGSIPAATGTWLCLALPSSSSVNSFTSALLALLNLVQQSSSQQV